MIWDTDIEEAFYNYIVGEFSEQTVVQIMNSLECDAFIVSYPMSSATKLVALHCESDYIFRSFELDWLNFALEVVTIRSKDGLLTFFFVNLNCLEEDYYLVSAAVIKIMNVAFPGKNLYAFKINEAVALGSGRSFSSKVSSGFVVSGLISIKTIDSFSELYTSLSIAEIDELPDTIRSFSPQEEKGDYAETSFFSPEELLSLKTIYSRYCKIEHSDELQLFSDETKQNSFVDTYGNAEKDLEKLANLENVSSYEELEKAERITVAQETGDDIVNSNTVEECVDYSEEAYRNAEQLLKEMLNRSKEDKQ